MPSAAMPSASIDRTFGRSSIPFDRKPTASNGVAKGHLSRFIVALVREQLDLNEIEASYASILSQPPFDPALMTALLLHGYASGI
jgi:hypothetical protein